ncbi:hypothetical protein DFH06DRAFT_1466268 [Mycena polygramma]|nr:hypothetical protein DFH06DRAFT_1466268 [Mycena polygramma]
MAIKGGLRGKETNFERLSRGLPPLPPTRRSSGIRPRVSATPLPIPKGNIKITFTDDQSTAYVGNTFNFINLYTATGQLDSSALNVTLPASACSGPFDITASPGPDAAHPLVGAVGGTNGWNFQAGKVGYAYLAGTGHTNANSGPSSTAGTSMQSVGWEGPSESQIWSLDCQTYEMKAQWTNSDLSQPATIIFYDPTSNFIGFTGELGNLDQLPRARVLVSGVQARRTVGS